jgi:hypothetical protein
MSEEEIKNDQQIPAEIKSKLVERVNNLTSNINNIEVAIKSSIEDAVDNNEIPITVTEIQSALLNVMKDFNKKEIMNLVK